MGLKKKNVLISALGITVPEAYAQVESLRVGFDGNCFAKFKIQTSRETMADKSSLDEVLIRTRVDKTLPVYKQVYEYAKKEIFKDWQDDIPEEEVL